MFKRVTVLLPVIVFLVGCDDSFFFSWDGTWKVQKRNLTVDLGECNLACRDEVDGLLNGQLEIRCDTSYSSFGRDSISCRLNCRGNCGGLTGVFSGEQTRVNERSIVDLSGSFRLDRRHSASQCIVVMPRGQLTLVKNSNNSISFDLSGQARNFVTGRRCRVTIFGDARK